MPIVMMTDRAAYEADPANVKVVRDYLGHEEGVHHGRLCPHHGVRRDGEDKTLTPECVAKAETFGDACRVFGPLYLRTSHVGLVLSLGERNGYDDSDFYARVWNPETGKVETVEYASTRGWTYPNNAAVDATPETLAAVRAAEERKAAEDKAAYEKWLAGMPIRGSLVRVVRGRKVAKGTEARVAWFGEDKRHNAGMNFLLRTAYWAKKYRIGIDTPAGRVFLAAENVEVLPEPETA